MTWWFRGTVHHRMRRSGLGEIEILMRTPSGCAHGPNRRTAAADNGLQQSTRLLGLHLQNRRPHWRGRRRAGRGKRDQHRRRLLRFVLAACLMSGTFAVPEPTTAETSQFAVVQARARLHSSHRPCRTDPGPTRGDRRGLEGPMLRGQCGSGGARRQGRWPAGQNDPVSFSNPFSEDVLRAGDTIQIRGTVAAGEGFRGYALEYGEGAFPTAWSTGGIVLKNGGKQAVDDGPLGSWNTKLLTRFDTSYTLRLRATYALGKSQTFARNVHFDPTLKKGWPVRIPRTIKAGSDTAYDSVPAPVVVDLDGDGQKEVIALKGGGDAPLWPRLLVFNADGSTRWARELEGGSLYWFWSAPPLVYDLDRDRELEVIVPSLNDGWIYAFQSDGSTKPGWPIRYTRSPFTTLVKVLAGDVDGDSRTDLVVVSYDWERDGNRATTTVAVHLYAPDGALKGTWTVKTPGVLVHDSSYWTALGNFDATPDSEIVVGVGLEDLNRKRYYYGVGWVCKGNGTVLPGWPVRFGNALGGNIVVADMDQDGDDDIVLSLLSATRAHQSGIHLLDGTGRSLPGWPRRQHRNEFSAPAVGDLDGDGRPEIVTLDYSSGIRDPQLTVLRADGSNLPGWPRAVADATNFGCGIADIDGDRSPEIVVDYMGNIYRQGSVVAYRIDGSIVAGFPKLMNTGQSHVDIADLDGDGMLELVAASFIEWSPWKESFPRRAGSIFVWELDGACDAKAIPWPRFQRDHGHTGRFETAPPEGVCNEGAPVDPNRGG